GSAALSASGHSNKVTTATLGVRALHELKLGAYEGRLHATLGWRHADGDLAPESRFAFDGGERFTVAGAPIAGNAALIEFGAQLLLTRNASLSVGYSGQFGDGNREHTGRVSLRWQF